MNLHDLTLIQVRESLQAGQFSAAEYASELIARAERAIGLNAISSSDYPGLLRSAQIQDAAGAPRDARLLLAGIPILLKDNIDTVGLPTSGGTPALKGRIPSIDAPCAHRLFNAGALLAGKTNMHELAFGITTNNAATGPVRNPWNQRMIPGGSSGGSGAAIAARMAPASIGTDTGASVRLPAALCGVVGFRPTVGRYPRGGIIPISHTRDTPGPIARSVDDCALLDGVLSSDFAPLADKPLSAIRIGLPRRYFFDGADAAVLAVMASAMEQLARRGVTFVPVEVPDLASLNEAVGFPVALYELTRDLPAYLAQAGYGIELAEVANAIASPDVAAIVRSQLGADAMPREAYEHAIKARVRMQAAYEQYFSGHQLDAMVFPTSILPARPIGEDETVELNGVRVPTMASYIRNTDPASNAGIPGISIPIGLTPDGLPVGLELDGPALGDRRLLALARAFERELPPMPAPSLAPGV